MTGNRLWIVIAGATLGALVSVTVAKWMQIDQASILAVGMGGGIVGAFGGRVVAKKKR